MTFKMIIAREEEQSLNEIMIDVIASASYHGVRDISIIEEEREGKIMFYHKGHLPIEEFIYLREKYKPNLYVFAEE